MPSRLANSWSDRARPVASSSNHARPRAIALISAGSHVELCFCCANPGRTNLVSAPRRVKAAAAVSSTALLLAASDADDATSSPNRRPGRSLMMIVFSSTMIFSTSSRTSFARSPGDPPSINEQAREQARLGGFSPAPMVARIGGELVPNSGPALIVDQGRLLTGAELTLVSYVAGVNWVREQCVEMTAREEFAAALGAIRCRAAFRPKPETVGLLLDPAHAAELTIEGKDAAHGLGLGRVDDERALVGVVAKRDIAAHPHALFL